MSLLLFVSSLCLYAHSALPSAWAARCLSRRSVQWPCERRWRLVGAAGRCLQAGGVRLVGLQALRGLVLLWVVGCAGARDCPGLWLLTDLRGFLPPSCQREPNGVATTAIRASGCAFPAAARRPAASLAPLSSPQSHGLAM